MSRRAANLSQYGYGNQASISNYWIFNIAWFVLLLYIINSNFIWQSWLRNQLFKGKSIVHVAASKIPNPQNLATQWPWTIFIKLLGMLFTIIPGMVLQTCCSTRHVVARPDLLFDQKCWSTNPGLLINQTCCSILNDFIHQSIRGMTEPAVNSATSCQFQEYFYTDFKWI